MRNVPEPQRPLVTPLGDDLTDRLAGLSVTVPASLVWLAYSVAVEAEGEWSSAAGAVETDEEREALHAKEREAYVCYRRLTPFLEEAKAEADKRAPVIVDNLPPTSFRLADAEKHEHPDGYTVYLWRTCGPRGVLRPGDDPYLYGYVIEHHPRYVPQRWRIPHRPKAGAWYLMLGNREFWLPTAGEAIRMMEEWTSSDGE